MPGSAELGHAFAVQLWASTLILIVLVLIWALAGAGGFWPVWVFLPAALALAIHGWIQLLRRRPAIWRRPHMTFALALTGGIWLSLTLFNIGVWAASGAGSFWPQWPALAFAIAFAIQASAVVFAAPTQQQMSERIDVLTSTRAGAVDAQEEKLRRIERDLHDGAQARLVALGMSLGMAEQKLDAAEPAAARELLAEARAGAEHALRELRDLARGIHPPVLADRGLEAAVRSLADLSPLPVTVSVDVAERPSAAVESAAYFVSAEGLANAAKHAGATRVDIRIVRRGPSLHMEIVDDGSGGADPDGSGLRGLRSRVQALDGTFHLLSPPGGPTALSAELPCG
jgi:signal transduction histidine kinase